MKKARRSFGKEYDCKKDWPEDCGVQCGGHGIVLASGSFEKTITSEDPLTELGKAVADKKSYITAFFEAFPNDPSTFIRGEGSSIEEAEEQAWNEFIKIKSCTNHEFERRHYRNGAGICKHCNLFNSKAFDPTTKCCICDKPTCYTQDINDKWYCEEHKDNMLEEDTPEWLKRHKHLKEYMKEKNKK